MTLDQPTPLVPSPNSRKGKLAEAMKTLTILRNEAQFWLNHRPEGYDEIEENATRISEVEEFANGLTEAIDALDALDVPDFRIR